MIHRYTSNGHNIVLDVNSGAIHVMDKIAFDLIPRVENLISNGITEEEQIADIIGSTSALSEVFELYRKGMLFSPDNYEEYIEEVKKRPTAVKALCLHIAHACNLACRYCFAEEGAYHGDCSLMSLDIAKRALDFLVKSSKNRRNLEVDFFGGEPLLNWNVIKEVVLYGRSLEKQYNKNFRFTLTTNGVLLEEEMFDFINREMSNVVLSIDGRREVNDRMRPLNDGSGSYDLIIEKYRKFIRSRKQADYYVRGTFTRHNLDFTEDVRHLAELGFKQISIEPMTRLEPTEAGLDADDFSVRAKDIETICKEYDKLASFIIERKKAGQAINFFHFMIDLSGGPCVAKRLSGCGAGTEYLAVTPWGDLYPCHQFVGKKEFLMGNVNDGLVADRLYREFRSASVYTKAKCRECFARFYCSGGCAANAYKVCGSINECEEISCDLERKRVECAIMLKVEAAVHAECH